MSATEPQTHLAIDHALCGTPVALGDGTATVRLETTPAMAVDDRGLVHGGFVFGAADHAAMLAVNHPNVVLGKSESRFLAPVEAGKAVTLVATRVRIEGRKHKVEVVGAVGGEDVYKGVFRCYVLESHVLDR